jgi:hypothetical protein
MRNFDGRHLDKQPDLTFRPMSGHIQTTNTVPTAIFIECKPIDSPHPLPSTYCRAGLIRFVNGDYAWAVDRAMMVGYVRNICVLPGGLLTCLGDARLASELALKGVLETLSPTASGDTVCQSTHEREFCLAAYFLRGAGTSVQLPCATSAAMPMLSPSVGCGWMVLPISTASAPISIARRLRRSCRRRYADDAAADDAMRHSASNISLVKPSSRRWQWRDRWRPTGTSRRSSPCPFALRFVLGQTDPRHFRVGVGDDGITVASKWRLCPAITSAATWPSCTALCASMGWPTMSPMAWMCATLVRIWHRPR